MPDKEKVIKGLECHYEDWKNGCTICPYKDKSTCHILLCGDALALLKEQEPRAPYYTRLKYLVNGREVEVNLPECPRCFDNGLSLWDAAIDKGQAYCKRCGQAVKWE